MARSKYPLPSLCRLCIGTIQDNRYSKESLFPLGRKTKDEIRRIAKDLNLCVADKRSTRGICFVGNVALKTFLKERLPEKKGVIKDTDGNVIGEHDGVQFFTIGQRKGFGVGGGVPYYVVEKDALENVVTVAAGDDHPALLASCVSLKNTHWIRAPRGDEDLIGRVRYLHSGEPLTLQNNSATFSSPISSVPPGQFLVIYSGDECLGGAVIDTVQTACYS